MAGGKKAAVAVLLVVMVVVSLSAVAPATAAGAPFMVCGVDADRMAADCGSYCRAGSRERAPRRECCDAVRGADFKCLCKYRDELRVMGNIDAARAMQIPSKCRIKDAPKSC
ncbi:putative lipid-transfer protein DIR1 [Oryza glaberrima]|uniref:Bifunctional inhibitor/plant lipid transfer protein/seed storage helical domain-containing protein n=1 Tax=Oryza glaberrima TaxID=4538 RepID=I1NUL2_ORYGL|nr:putative lipid-transfer protein DIR1 [Oryza glaberrima]